MKNHYKEDERAAIIMELQRVWAGEVCKGLTLVSGMGTWSPEKVPTTPTHGVKDGFQPQVSWPLPVFHHQPGCSWLAEKNQLRVIAIEVSSLLLCLFSFVLFPTRIRKQKGSTWPQDSPSSQEED